MPIPIGGNTVVIRGSGPKVLPPKPGRDPHSPSRSDGRAPLIWHVEAVASGRDQVAVNYMPGDVALCGVPLTSPDGRRWAKSMPYGIWGGEIDDDADDGQGAECVECSRLWTMLMLQDTHDMLYLIYRDGNARN